MVRIEGGGHEAPPTAESERIAREAEAEAVEEILAMQADTRGAVERAECGCLTSEGNDEPASTVQKMPELRSDD